MFLKRALFGVIGISLFLTLLLVRAQDAEKETRRMMIDTRSASSFEAGAILGSISIHLRGFSDKVRLAEIFAKQLDAFLHDDIWNSDQAKTLTPFCNGPWCEQSSAAIKKLLRVGYPAHLLKYYRGGMQGWKSLGLTVVVI